MQSAMIRIGSFFFRYRNRVFPLIIIAIYLLAPPPSSLFGSDRLEETKDMVAMLVALSGLALRGLVIGYVYIKRGGMNKKVYAENLVTHGIFGLCRNPLYVGNILIYVGVFLMHGDPAVIVLGMVVFLFIYQCIVLAEEAYLLDKFGDGYRAYCRDVPRWLPKISNFSRATEGMHFNFRRVILKDYTTMATTVIMLAITESYEKLFYQPYHAEQFVFLASVIVCTGAMAGVVRLLKKRNWLTESPAA